MEAVGADRRQNGLRTPVILHLETRGHDGEAQGTLRRNPRLAHGFAGRIRLARNPARGLPPTILDFGDAEAARIRAALETWVSYGVNADRHWLEPLLAAIVTTGTSMAPSGNGEDSQRLI